MPFSYKHAGAVLLFLNSTIQVLSQVLPFHHYTIDHGLVSNGVTVLLQDLKGYLWIGTGEGLSLFDGTVFRNFTVADGLPRNGITSLAESRTSPGTIYVGTWGGGVTAVRNHQFTTLVADSSPLAMNVIDVEEDHSGTLWVVAQSGVLRLANGHSYQVPGTGDASAVIVAPDSLIWIVNGSVVHIYAPGSGVEVGRLTLPGYGIVTSIHPDRYGSIWIATSDSLLIEMKGRNVVSQRLMPFNGVFCIVDDVQGNLLFGATFGLFRLTHPRAPASRLVGYARENGLPSDWVRTCLVDFENNLWIGGEGIARLSDWNIQTFPLDGVPVSYNNSRAATDERGHVWCVTGSGVVELWKDQDAQWESHLHEIRIDLRSASMPTIVHHGKSLFIDTGHRLVVYSVDSVAAGRSVLKKTREFKPGRDIPDVPRFFFVVDSRDNLWISVLAKGVYRVNLSSYPSQFKHYSSSSGLPHDDIRVIYEDRTGNIWFGSVSDGIAVLPVGGDSVTVTQNVKSGLPDDHIRGIVEDKRGRLWIGTRRNGIGIYQDDQIKHISVGDGLIGAAVWGLTADDDRNLIWVGTQFGVQGIDQTTLKPVQPKQALVREPVPSLGTYRGQFLWYVSTSSLTVYSYGEASPPTSPPRVYITGLMVSGKKRDLNEHREFPHDQNVCVIEYGGISYRDADAMRFQHRLLGAESEWQAPTSQRTVTYASLSPGSYAFEVRATNSEGATTTIPARLSFFIAPPFWATWWFRGLSVMMLVSSLVVFYVRRVRMLEKEKAQQREFSLRLLDSQETERKRIAGELHDSLVQNLLVAKNRSLMGLRNTGDPRRVTGEFEEISAVLGAAIDEVRGIAHNLRPYQLDRMGFSKAARSLVTKLSETTPIQLHAEITDVDTHLSEITSTHLYRILQEALNNVLKHSEATSASISLSSDDSMVELQVYDDGKGMSMEGTPHEGFGLDGISQRTNLMGGTYEMTSVPGNGTSLIVRIPKQASRDGKEDNSTHS